MLNTKYVVIIEDNDEYRIINSVTKKPIKSDKYEIEKLDWIEL